jgi:class 3 adenylate cyclase
VDVPETRFTTLGGDRIAYQVMGEGPVDLLYVATSGECLDLRFDYPASADFWRRLASFTRLILFDRRGTGASDGISYEGLPPWEQWADDVRAVLDVAGSEQTVVLGSTDTGTTALFFAATVPERTRSLILFNGSARYTATDDYPLGLPSEMNKAVAEYVMSIWGTESLADIGAPSMAGDPVFRRWYAKSSRVAQRPRDAAQYLANISQVDVRQILSLIQSPTLVIHREAFRYMPVEQGRYLAEHIPNAKFIVVPGEDSTLYTEAPGEILSVIEEFLTGSHPMVEPDRILAAVLFTDIVGSTERAASLGDRRWRDLLQSHETLTRTIVGQFRGNLIKTTGDGALMTFDGPGRAIRCALALQEALRPLEIEIRAGLHTGEVELIGSDIGGIGVHVAARVLEHAGPGELIASAAVPMLVAGSGIEFLDRGEHELKGVPGQWRLFAVQS